MPDEAPTEPKPRKSKAPVSDSARIEAETAAAIAANKKTAPAEKGKDALIKARIAQLEKDLASTEAIASKDGNARTVRITHIKQNLDHYKRLLTSN